MKGLLQYLVTSLVDHPERVSIRETLGQKNVVYMVYLDAEDMPRIIGRNGRVANAVRILLRAVGELNEKAIWVEFSRG